MKTKAQVNRKLRQYKRWYNVRIFKNFCCNVSNNFNILYGNKIERKNKPMKKHKKSLIPTDHSRMRFAERFEQYWYTFKQILEDIKKWWTHIKLVENGKFSVRWQLWTYIVAKDMTILSMYIEDFLLAKMENEKIS